jgi:hypothetical protein
VIVPCRYSAINIAMSSSRNLSAPIRSMPFSVVAISSFQTSNSSGDRWAGGSLNGSCLLFRGAGLVIFSKRFKRTGHTSQRMTIDSTSGLDENLDRLNCGKTRATGVRSWKVVKWTRILGPGA